MSRNRPCHISFSSVLSCTFLLACDVDSRNSCPSTGPIRAAMNVVMATPETCRQAARGDSRTARHASRAAGVRAIRTRIVAYSHTVKPPSRSTAIMPSTSGNTTMRVRISSTNITDMAVPKVPSLTLARRISNTSCAPMKPKTKTTRPAMRNTIPAFGAFARVRTPSGLIVTFERPNSELNAAITRHPT